MSSDKQLVEEFRAMLHGYAIASTRWRLLWKRKAKEYRAAARLSPSAWRKNARIRRAQWSRIEALEQVLADLLVGAEQQSQSHVDVSVKCRKALGYGQAEVEALLVEYGVRDA